MRRRVFIVPVVCFVLAGVLVGLALMSRPAESPRVHVAVGAFSESGSARSWPVDVRLGAASSEADLVLTIRFPGSFPVASSAELALCADIRCSRTAARFSIPHPRGTVSTGRIGTIEPEQTVHLRLALMRVRASRIDLAVNATPCGAPAQDQLWRIRQTEVRGQPNTVAGIANCATRPVPFLPVALEVAGVGAAALVASRRYGP